MHECMSAFHSISLHVLPIIVPTNCIGGHIGHALGIKLLIGNIHGLLSGPFPWL